MEQIIRQFALANEVGGPEPVRTGFINDSFKLPALHEGGIPYFLQRINHHIFENVEGLQQNILKVTGHIRQKLIAAGETDVERKVLHLIPTRDGKLFYRTPEGDCWRVYRLIENALSMDKVTPESAGLAGRPSAVSSASWLTSLFPSFARPSRISITWNSGLNSSMKHSGITGRTVPPRRTVRKSYGKSPAARRRCAWPKGFSGRVSCPNG